MFPSKLLIKRKKKIEQQTQPPGHRLLAGTDFSRWHILACPKALALPSTSIVCRHTQHCDGPAPVRLHPETGSRDCLREKFTIFPVRLACTAEAGAAERDSHRNHQHSAWVVPAQLHSHDTEATKTPLAKAKQQLSPFIPENDPETPTGMLPGLPFVSLKAPGSLLLMRAN